MFDISFGELAVILVVMLLVLGPQKATETARNIGRFVAKVKTMAHNVSSEFNSYSQPIKESYEQLKNIEEQIHSSVMDIETSPKYIKKNINKPLRKKIKVKPIKKKLRRNIKS
jgi:sec-independent protein translocase protein TatB